MDRIHLAVDLPTDGFDRESRRGWRISVSWQDWLANPDAWGPNPLVAYYDSDNTNVVPEIAGAFLLGLLTIRAGSRFRGSRFGRFAAGFSIVFLLTTVSYILAGQKVIKAYNLEYALWALAVGLLISNTVGTANWVRPAVRTEFYIKTGLFLLGAEVLFNPLLTLGVPGIFIAWVVTPIVLITTFWFGQRI